MNKACRIIFALTVLFALLLCGCASAPEPIHPGETYLDGCWYLSQDGLHVGYNLFPDGGGFMFINDTVHPLRYGIYRESIYLAVGDTEVTSFPFARAGESLLIGGIEYLPLKHDEATDASVDAFLSQMASATASKEEATKGEEKPPIALLAVVSVLLAAGVAVFCIKRFGKGRQV